MIKRFYRRLRDNRLSRGLLVLALICSIGLQPTQRVQAVSLLVSNLNDSGAGSLRQVIEDAAPGDTITFSPLLTGTLTLSSEEITIDKHLMIIGPGTNRITLSGDDTYLIFDIFQGINVTIESLTISHGFSDSGGGIHNLGSLYLRNVTLSNNNSSSQGGAINNTGSLQLENVTISGNTAQAGGGGISIDWTSKTSQTATIVHTTITQNHGQDGGGIYFQDPSAVNHLSLNSSLLAENTDVGDNSPDCFAPLDDNLISNGYNLFGDSSGCEFTPADGDLLGTDSDPIDPDLGALGLYGGATAMHALLPGSPAMDSGSSAAGAGSDQRGWPRPLDGDGDGIPLPDIGAYEYQNLPPELVNNLGQTMVEDGTLSLTTSMLQISDPENSPSLITYTVPVSPTFGQLMRIGNPLQGPFVQDDIDQGRITFRHDGSENTDSYFLFYGSDRPGFRTRMVSITPAEVQGNHNSSQPAVSSGGQFVAFQSNAVNLVSNDFNIYQDIYLFNRLDGTLELVSLDSGGGNSNGDSSNASISGDGRLVVFSSFGSNLVSDDGNGTEDIFLRDMLNSTTEILSMNASGYPANGQSQYPAISADGRWVAFASRASDLVSSDNNNASDIFLYSLQAHQITRVSVHTSGAEGNAASTGPLSISSNGRYIAFSSSASNLVNGDTNNQADVFILDRLTGRTVRIAPGGIQPDLPSNEPSLSGDGRYVAFVSAATNLILNDTNGENDIFLYDRRSDTIQRVSVDSGGGQGDGTSGGPALSADGQSVSFWSHATNLVPDDTNNFCGPGEDENCPDVFFHTLQDGLTRRVSVSSDGSQGVGSSAYPGRTSLSGDGRLVSYASEAENLLAIDNNAVEDVFLHDTGVIYSQFTIDVTPINDTPGVSILPQGGISYEGSTINFVGTYNDPDGTGVYTIHWDFGDGGTAGGTLYPSHVFAENGVYTVTLTIEDDLGAVGLAERPKNIQNRAPVVEAGPGSAINPGDTFLRSGYFTDPGTDTWTVTVDYGDGTPAQNVPFAPDKTFQLSHVYSTEGTFLLLVTVMDDDGGIGMDSVMVSVGTAKNVFLPLVRYH